MCVPGCQETVARRLSRRTLVKGAGFAAMAGAASVSATPPARAQFHATINGVTQVVDLTHTLGTDFPTFAGTPNLELETLVTLDADGYNMKRWLLIEHTGTHMDAPIHFSHDGHSADEIPVESLVVPLAVVDIAARAAEDPDTLVTPDDLVAWEADHGPIPPGACVAMYSGWEHRLGTANGFRNADDQGVMHFPGFHIEAADFLIDERQASGIAVDTLSLDHGPSADFAVHYRWLPSNRWGLEAVANLSTLPAAGATLVVGGPKIRGATGGPTRLFALA